MDHRRRWAGLARCRSWLVRAWVARGGRRAGRWESGQSHDWLRESTLAGRARSWKLGWRPERRTYLQGGPGQGGLKTKARRELARVGEHWRRLVHWVPGLVRLVGIVDRSDVDSTERGRGEEQKTAGDAVDGKERRMRDRKEKGKETGQGPRYEWPHRLDTCTKPANVPTLRSSCILRRPQPHRGPGRDPQRACGLPKIDVDACRREDKHRVARRSLAACCVHVVATAAASGGIVCVVEDCARLGAGREGPRCCSLLGKAKIAETLGLKRSGRPHALSNPRAPFEAGCDVSGWPGDGK